MARVRRAPTTAYLLCGATAACGAFGTSPVAEAPVDPGPDAGALDAAATDAAATDATSSPRARCFAYPFCDDFEREPAQLLARGWSPDVAAGGTLVIDDGASSSPTRSLLVELPTATDQPSRAVLFHGSVAGKHRVELAFDLALDAPYFRRTEIAAARIERVPETVVRLQIVEGGLVFSLEVDSSVRDERRFDDIQGSPWAAYELEVELAGDGGTSASARLRRDGGSLGEIDLDVHEPDILGRELASVSIGAGSSDEPVPHRIRYDDVGIRTE